MKKTTIALLATLGLSTALFAFGPGGHKCGHGPFGAEHRGGLFKLVKQLDLTSEQKDTLKALKKSRKDMMQAKREEMKEKRQEMHQQNRPDMSTFMSAKSFDKEAFKAEVNKKIEAMHKKMEAKKDDMLEKRAEMMQKIFNVLTPEQRVKLIELSKKQ